MFDESHDEQDDGTEDDESDIDIGLLTGKLEVARVIFQRRNSHPTHACRPPCCPWVTMKDEHVKDVEQDVAQGVSEDVPQDVAQD